MQVANVRVRLNKLGSDVPVFNVTPAEAVLLHVLHGPSNGGLTFGDEFAKIEVIGEALVDGPDRVEIKTPAQPAVGVPSEFDYVPAVPAVVEVTKGPFPRTNRQELIRLTAKYNQALNKEGKSIISQLWPDKMNPTLPKTFTEINWTEVTEASADLVTAPVNYITGKPL